MGKSEDDATLRRSIVDKYVPLILAEYQRIGIAAEMDLYFKGSGSTPVTPANFERSLNELRAIPSGIGFDAYCARAGMDAEAIRELHERVQSLIRNGD